MRLSWIVLPCALALAACTTAVRPVAEPLARDAGEGLIYVYIRPPAAAGAAALPLQSAAVAREDGAELPLRLDLQEIRAGGVPRETLLAHGAVAAGRFSAVVLRTAEAAEIRVPVAFQLPARQSAVLSLIPEPPQAVADARGPFAVELAPRPAVGVLALVSCPDEGTLALLDKRSGRVGAVVPAGRGVRGIAVDPSRRRAYVAVAGEDALAAIDLDRAALAEVRATSAGDEPYDLALTPDGRVLVVANFGAASVSFVDAESLGEIRRISVGDGPAALVLDNSGRGLFVLNSRASTISVIEVLARTGDLDPALVQTFTVEPGPFRARLDRAQRRLWVIHDGSPYLVEVDAQAALGGAAAPVVNRVLLGSPATAIALDRTDRIHVARRDGTGIDVYDPLSRLPIDTLPLAGPIAYLALDADNDVLGAACGEPPAARAFGLLRRAPAWLADIGTRAGYVAFVGSRP
ncbi:MAG: YncE family protein [Acidobacteria bacterium]|nr:YncE family protein [Acidobacteriota bacterium]